MENLYNNNFVNTERGVTEEDTSLVETRFEFTFPNDIRSHYLTYNGGEPEKCVFIADDGSEYIITQFLPIKYDEESGRNIEYVLETLRVDGILPDWLIPFADEPGGDLYCFSLQANHEGAIYYWSHEYEYGENPENHVTYLAESLKAFINRMVEDK